MTPQGLLDVVWILIYAANTGFGGLAAGGCEGSCAGRGFQKVSTRRRLRRMSLRSLRRQPAAYGRDQFAHLGNDERCQIGFAGRHLPIGSLERRLETD